MEDLKTPDVIVIECDNIKPRLTNENKAKSQKRREVTFNQVDNLESIFITQNVHLKKPKIDCVINLTTDVFDSQSECHITKPYERIVPKCDRPMCQSAIDDILKRHSRKKSHTTKKHRSHQKRTGKSKKPRACSKSCMKKKSKNPKASDTKIIVKDTLSSLSSVSSSPFVSDISYEDVSMDSFSWCSDREELKIDTLIKRARARERCVTPKFSEKPLGASTPPNIIELSSDEEMHKANESIHSLETFVLNLQSDHTISSNSSTGHKDEVNDKKNFSLPMATIDLTEEKSCIKHSKCFVNNYSIKSRTNNMI